MIPPQSYTGFYQRSGNVTVSTVCRIVLLSVMMLATSIVAPANAASINTTADTTYNVTDLGSNYTLQQDPSGTVHSVTSGDRSRTYAFEKSPVTITTTFPPSSPFGGGVYEVTTFTSGNLAFYSLMLDANPNEPGNHQVDGPNNYNWGTLLQPINDINPSGYTVGGGGGPNAAFVTYPGNLGTAQYLSYVISDAPGVLLSSAVKVDDLGDILAQGTLNGASQYFLLTPNGPPTPIPAPEPSALVVLAVGITVLGVRSWLRTAVPYSSGS
jgi:hypothetical protein